MFFDLNLHEDFADFEELEKIECSGFCIAFSIDDIGKALGGAKLDGRGGAGSRLYTRLDMAYNTKLDSYAMGRLRQLYDVICITTDSLAAMPTIAKLEPDLVRVRLEEIRHAKKTLAGTLGESGMHIELCVRDALRGQRVLWMNACRRLIRLGCRRSLVISSGAESFVGLKGRRDLARILGLFGLGEGRSGDVLDNSGRLLRLAALRRYSCREVIANSVERGSLKQDFIVNFGR